jgi:hypothetical protein
MIEGSGSISQRYGGSKTYGSSGFGSYGSGTPVVTYARAGELPAGGGGLHPVRRYQAVPGGPARGIHPEPAEAARGSSS